MVNNTRFFLFFLLLVTVVNSCSLDKERNLGDGYFLAGYGTSTVIYKRISEKEDKEILLGEIVNCQFDDNFILIYRKVSEEVIEHFNDHPLSEIMRGGDSLQYWIIEKTKNSVYGPFNLDEFDVQRITNKVPNELILK